MTTETGIVGSIGVWTMLVDMTKGLSKNGIEVTMIRAGERKARGGPYETPDDETFARLQGWVDDTWQIFAEHVAECRAITADAVRSLEGDWYDRQGNALNLAKRKDNRSGVIGVGWYPRTGKWRARITIAGKTKAIGHYSTFEEACAARARAQHELGFHPNHGR